MLEYDSIMRRKDQRARREQLVQAWKPAWDGLPEPEREAIRREILAANPFLKKAPRLVEGFCLEALARRQSDPPEPTT